MTRQCGKEIPTRMIWGSESMRNRSASRGLAAAVIGCGAASVAMAQGVMDQMSWDLFERGTIIAGYGAMLFTAFKICEWVVHKARGGKGNPDRERLIGRMREELTDIVGKMYPTFPESAGDYVGGSQTPVDFGALGKSAPAKREVPPPLRVELTTPRLGKVRSRKLRIFAPKKRKFDDRA